MDRFPTSPSLPARPAIRRGLRWSVPALAAFLQVVLLLSILAFAVQPQFPAAGRLAREADIPTAITAPSRTPTWTFDDRTQIGTLLGAAVATAGDINGDGYEDALIGAERYSISIETEGAAFVFLGSNKGLNIEPAWVSASGKKGARYGGAVAGAGDINADGFDDIIIGAYRYNPVFPEEGAAFVYYGSAGGLPYDPSWTYLGGQKSAQLGSAVACAGDINGDGYDDVLIGAPLMEYNATFVSEGVAFLFWGGDSGLSTNPGWSQPGGKVGAQFGASLAGVGDVNGDGYDDFLVGAPNPAQQGQVFLYYGGAAGPASTPDWSATDDQTGSQFGSAIAGAGDLNQDGYADFIIGAPDGRAGEIEVGGMVYVYFGAENGPGTAPDWVLHINQPNARFGTALSGAGDANGDGFDDFLVGAPNYDQYKPDEGGIFLYAGTDKPTTTPVLFWTTYGNKAEAFLGKAVSGSTTHGGADFNFDGRIDLLAGAPEYSLDTFIVGRTMAYYGQEVIQNSTKSVFVPILFKTP